MSASGSPQKPDRSRDWEAPYRVDLRAVLGNFQRGPADPAMHLDADGSLWRATRTPEGPATLRLMSDGTAVSCAAWGPGADWAVAQVPTLLGADDDPSGFPEHLLPESLHETWRRIGSRWRAPRSQRVMEAAMAAVLEQKVTGVQARRAWSALLREAGDVAPGPTPRPMHVPPEPALVRRVPSWQWHRWGVEPPQSKSILRLAQVAHRVEQCAGLPIGEARRRLLSIDGIGPWTVAEITSRALGDADAISVGDFHLAGQLVYVFTGEADGGDERMLELLEPFAGHRQRVQRLVELSGITRPARGPRMTISDHRRH